MVRYPEVSALAYISEILGITKTQISMHTPKSVKDSFPLRCGLRPIKRVVDHQKNVTRSLPPLAKQVSAAAVQDIKGYVHIENTLIDVVPVLYAALPDDCATTMIIINSAWNVFRSPEFEEKSSTSTQSVDSLTSSSSWLVDKIAELSF